jgi:hypothetical protein
MDYLVTDEKYVNDDGTPKEDAAIFENFILCHPSIAEKAKEGCKQLMGWDLEIITFDEWEKKNNSVIGES